MLARVNTLTFNGLEILDVDLQVQLASGLPAFNIVGLPDKAIAESKERVRAALQSLGLSLPAKRITINLSPADLLKEGSHFDPHLTYLASYRVWHLALLIPTNNIDS